MRRAVLLIVCCALLFAGVANASAITVEDLAKRIEELEQRVAHLEAVLERLGVQEQGEQPSSPAIGKSAITFEGSGMQSTAPFTVSEGWTLTWTSNDSLFFVSVHTKDGRPIEMFGNSKSGSAYIPKGGTYYLKVNSTGDWVIKVKE